jgi:uncharacterized integral membrane protein
MGESQKFQELTIADRIAVFLYRTGIIVTVLCIVYGAYLVYSLAKGAIIASPGEMTAALAAFFVSIGISISLLHLYSRKILRIVRALFVIAALILIPYSIFNFSDRLALEILASPIGVIGLGFLFAAFSAIGAKEAFCFRLYEGYAYGIVSALLVFVHLGTVLFAAPDSLLIFKTILLFVISILTVLFTLKKMRLPLHYDIGDKSRYG